MSEGNQTLSLWKVTKSVLSAGFGVQSNENRERDFKHGKASQFIFIGLVFTLVFILGVWSLVSLVMKVAGA
jgi:hypothetical protein